MKVLYTAEALATGDSRNGHPPTDEGRGRVDLEVIRPAPVDVTVSVVQE